MNEPVMDRKVNRHEEIVFKNEKKIGDKLKLRDDDKDYGEFLKNGATFAVYMPSGGGDDVRRQVELESIRKVARHYQASNSFVLLEPNEENEKWIRTLTGFDNNKHNSQEDGLSAPVLIRVEEDLKPILYPSSHDWTFSSLSQFIDRKMEVAVPHATESNIDDLGHREKYLAVAIVDPDDEKTNDYLSGIRQFASSCSSNIRKQYQFVWINGKEWTSFLEKFSISLGDSPQLFVLDYPNDIYWTNPYQPSPSSSSSSSSSSLSFSTTTEDIRRFLVDIDMGKIMSINLNAHDFRGRNIGGYFGKNWDHIMYLKDNPWLFDLEIFVLFFCIVLLIPPSFGRVHDYIEKYIWQGVIDRILCYFGLISDEDEAKKND